jgi:TonB family protein
MVQAQERLGANLERGTFARSLERAAPTYPTRELRQSQQGWVKLNYVVSTDGTVLDPVIEDSSGNRSFEKAALRVVRKWRFEPATWDLEPVEQCHTETMITFVIEGREKTATSRFAHRFKKINRNIEDGAFAEARQLLDETFESWRLNAYEVARLWILDGNLAHAMQDDAGQLSSYRKATASGGTWLEKHVYLSTLVVIVIHELKFGEYAGALRDYETLIAAGAKKEDLAAIDSVIESIRAAVSGKDVIATPALLQVGRQCEKCEADWQYLPLRRNFRLADIDGNLNKLEIRCDWKRVTDTARAGVRWTIPESWGSCRVIVFGENGTSFNVLEEPDSA